MQLSLRTVAHREENYLLFSDVHLGADLVQHAAPWTLARLKEAARVDRDLTAMLEHYRRESDPERPWCLVIAGDLVDFVGMSIAPVEVQASALSEEEHEHGLGSSSDHAAQKMRAVAVRHSRVFAALANFVAEGHRLVLVRGNHDVEFHWESAQRAFIDALVSRVDVSMDDAVHDAFVARIEFAPWFYYVEGLLYVEHGHQYDATCSYENQLAPVSPEDPERIHWSFSDILMRWVVRPTRGLCTEGHEYASFLDYLKLPLSMGFSGAIALGKRYVLAIVRMIMLSRWRLSLRAQEIRAEHERRMETLAAKTRIGIERIRALRALHVPPLASRAFGVLVGLFADRVLMGIGAIAIAALLAFIAPPWWIDAIIATAVVIPVGGLLRHATRLRTDVFRYGESMKTTARRIAKLFPARFVVMGHTHEPFMERYDEATYVNLGAWAVDELSEGPAKDAPRTHLVIRTVGGKVSGALCRWDSGGGVSFVATSA